MKTPDNKFLQAIFGPHISAMEGIIAAGAVLIILDKLGIIGG